MGAAVAGRFEAGGVPLRDAGLGPVDRCADGAQWRLPVSGLSSPNEWRISGGEPQAKRGGLAVRCKALLGAVTVPEPIQGTAFRNSRSRLAGDRAGNAGWFLTRPLFAGFETGRANLESVLFGRL